MAKRSGRAVNGGQEGRSERPTRGRGQFRAAGLLYGKRRLACCTENADFVSAFPWAEAGEAKVRKHPLVLIRGILPRGALGGCWLSVPAENKNFSPSERGPG